MELDSHIQIANRIQNQNEKKDYIQNHITIDQLLHYFLAQCIAIENTENTSNEVAYDNAVAVLLVINQYSDQFVQEKSIKFDNLLKSLMCCTDLVSLQKVIIKRIQKIIDLTIAPDYLRSIKNQIKLPNPICTSTTNNQNCDSKLTHVRSVFSESAKNDLNVFVNNVYNCYCHNTASIYDLMLYLMLTPYYPRVYEQAICLLHIHDLTEIYT